MAAKGKVIGSVPGATPDPNAVTTSSDISEGGAAAGLLPSGVPISEQILKKDYAAQYAFWHQDDIIQKDANGKPVLDANGNKIVLGLGPIGTFFEKAIDPKNDWVNNTSLFNAKLQSDPAWQALGGSEGLTAMRTKFTDPTTWAQSEQTRYSEIQQLAASKGYTLTPDQIQGLTDTSLFQAYDSGTFNNTGYTNNLLSQIVGIATKAAVAPTGGTGQQTINDLRKYASDQGVTMPDSFFNDAANKLNDPNSGMTIETYQNNIKGYAQSKYSGFSQRIANGETVATIAAPYKQEFQSILGIPSDSIDLTASSGDGALLKNALSGNVDPSTGIAQPMSIFDFQKQLRSDPRWNSTPDAAETMNGIVEQIGRMFGKI